MLWLWKVCLKQMKSLPQTVKTFLLFLSLNYITEYKMCSLTNYLVENGKEFIFYRIGRILIFHWTTVWVQSYCKKITKAKKINTDLVSGFLAFSDFLAVLRILVWLPIFLHVLDVFSVLSNHIKPIPFHERSVSHGTSLEYHQQGNRSNLKIHFFRLRGVFRGP